MNILLHGFRATGKTTIAKALRKQLPDYQLIELDQLIIQQSGQSISQLTQDGTSWTPFRKLESQLFCNHIKPSSSPSIISTGGGTCVNDVTMPNSSQTFGQHNLSCLREHQAHNVSIILTANEADITSRLLKDQDVDRPAFSTSTHNQETYLHEQLTTLQQRQPLYNQISDHHFNTSKQSIESIVTSILNLL